MNDIFQKIIEGTIPAEKVFENELFIVIKDIHPQAPVHLLIITKKKIAQIQAIEEEDKALMGEVMWVAKQMAKKFGVDSNYRLVTNNGPDAGQTIYHLHFHLIGGKPLGPMA